MEEGIFNEEVAEFLGEYEATENQTEVDTVLTGFDALDRYTSGMVPGDLWLIAGFAGHGKSQTVFNMAYNAIRDGKNVIYLLNEVTRKQLRLKMATRHSWTFGDGPGLKYRDVKEGKLNESDKQLLIDSVRDWENLGKLFVSNLPRSHSIDYVHSVIHRCRQIFEPIYWW